MIAAVAAAHGVAFPDLRWLGVVQTLAALGALGCATVRLTTDLTIEQIAHGRALASRNPALAAVWLRLCAMNRRSGLVRFAVLGRGPLSVATALAAPRLGPFDRAVSSYQAVGLTLVALVLLGAGLWDLRDARAAQAALRAQKAAPAGGRVKNARGQRRPPAGRMEP